MDDVTTDGNSAGVALGGARFWSKVVKGPGPEDCWIWVGAIGDDGYGRYWENTPTGQRVWRAHRYAAALLLGGGLDENDVVRHERCDVPLCVHASGGADSHLILGTVADNNLDRSRAGRHANMYSFRRSGARRKDQAALSREIRATLLEHGWDESITALLAGYAPDEPKLF